MLEHNSSPASNLNSNLNSNIGFATFDLNAAVVGGAAVDGVSTSAQGPKANAPLTLPSLAAPPKLAELSARAETLLAHLEARLTEERDASERAARVTADIDERLRLGVRMLQALDVQAERGEAAATRAKDILLTADDALRASASATESSIAAMAERVSREKFEWLERELSWRFDRVKEVEARIEAAAHGQLAWLDAELQTRLDRVGDALTRTLEVSERSEATLARLESAGENIERAERATAALAGLTSEGQRQIETLVQRTSDASALREILSTLTHELHASREVVQGEMRRMRDDLGWLVDKGERVTGELVEHAAHATQVSEALRVRTTATVPIVHELGLWTDVLTGDNRERIRPISDAIASSVRTELSSEMRSFSAALRQLAVRADGAFAHIEVDASLLAPDAKDLARSFASELSRLNAVSLTTSASVCQIETNPSILAPSPQPAPSIEIAASE